MTMEKLIKKAYVESAEGRRQGDKIKEVKEIQKYILNAKNIVVPNKTKEKVKAINEVLEKFGIQKAKHLKFYTDACDLNRTPAISKALMALDIVDCDLVIARGRLGVPGSGSMLVIMDSKGRILSAALSPPHIIHKKSVEKAVKDEMITALKRIGLNEKHES